MMPKKPEDDLAAKLRAAREAADAYLDARAAEIAKQSPGVPVGIIRQTISRGGNCPCSYALNLLDEEKAVA
jgi:hypothetical protein